MYSLYLVCSLIWRWSIQKHIPKAFFWFSSLLILSFSLMVFFLPTLVLPLWLTFFLNLPLSIWSAIHPCAFIPSDNPSYFGLKCKRIFVEYIALLILYAVIILCNAFYNIHYNFFLCQRFVKNSCNSAFGLQCDFFLINNSIIYKRLNTYEPLLAVGQANFLNEVENHFKVTASRGIVRMEKFK